MNILQKTTRSYQAIHLNVFTEQLFCGNAATVIWRSNGLSSKEMQLLAKELNTPETIFIDINDNDELSLRFFTPIKEVSSCGHGSLAAAYVANMMGSQQKSFHSPSGNLPFKKSENLNNSYRIVMPLPKLLSLTVPDHSLINALKLSCIKTTLKGYLTEDNSGTKRLLIKLSGNKKLSKIKPDFVKLSHNLQALGLVGIFIFSLLNETGSEIEGRMFAPVIGIDEDAVNGNSAIALTTIIHSLCLENNFKCPKKINVHQGASLNRQGVVTTLLECKQGQLSKISLEGSIREVFRFDMRLP